MVKKALVLIDVQKGFLDTLYWGARNNPDFETNLKYLINRWRESLRPIYHVQHLSVIPNSPLRPNSSGCAFMEFAEPVGDEPIFTKNVNSAFIGTHLEQNLKQAGVQEVVITGLTTDHCVSTSVRMAANYGFKVVVPFDCVATFPRTGYDGQVYEAELVHQTALASLNKEFAEIMESKFIS